MRIEVHTTHQITGQESLKAEVAAMVEHALSHVVDHVTSVQVHLDRENGTKSGDHDVRCTIEARGVGPQPVAVTAHAASVAQATLGAAGKLARALDSVVGRQSTLQRAGPGTAELSAPTA